MKKGANKRQETKDKTNRQKTNQQSEGKELYSH